MTSTSSNLVVVGGGTTGLLAAALLSKRQPDRHIILIEKSGSLGGLLRSFDYGENGRFDYGAHNFQETLITEIDELFLNLIPEDQWHILPGAKREIAGNFFNGKVHTNTPFIDLRNLHQTDYEDCVRDFFLNLNTQNGCVQDYPEDAYGFCMTRYGRAITDRVMAPAVQKLFGKDIREIHRLPLLFLPFSRVSFLDEHIVCDLTRSEILRERIAYTNQRELPLERSSGKRIFYPQKMGMQQLIDGFEKLLNGHGVEIIKNATVTRLEIQNQQIGSLTLQMNDDQSEHQITAEQVFWTAGIHPLAGVLDLFYTEDTFDKPLRTVFVHYRLDHRPELEDIYFLYPFDAGFLTYRVVNYPNYCPEAAQGPDYPITLEMFLPADMPYDPEQLKQRGFDELCQMKIIPANTMARFSAVETTMEGFPMPTLRNMNLTKARRDRIHAMGLKNLILMGILAQDDLLFHKDIILDTYQKITQLIPVQSTISLV